MAAAPLISVVIPCYNQGHFLADAISSAASHASRLALEIVVIDDGSTDDTGAVAKRAGDVVYIRQANAGLAAARNAGLARSRGDLIVFLDADDMLAPEGLDAGAGAMARHPECALVTGRCVMMDAAGALLPTPRQAPLAGSVYRELLRQNYIWMPAIAMFRRTAVIEAGGFDSTANAAADYALYLAIARASRVHDHGGIVAYYRQHGRNMSADAGRMLRETLQVHRRERSRARFDDADLEAWREGRRRWQDFYGTRLVEEIRHHVRSGERVTAVRKALTLARHHPRGLTHHALKKLRLLARSQRPSRARAK